MTGMAVKDPVSELLYTFDWADVCIAPITLDSVAYTLPSGIAQVTTALDQANKKSSILLSGGTHGTDYLVEAKATLSNGEKVDASVLIRGFNK